jgi:acid phosphatase type 7
MYGFKGLTGSLSFFYFGTERILLKGFKERYRTTKQKLKRMMKIALAILTFSVIIAGINVKITATINSKKILAPLPANSKNLPVKNKPDPVIAAAGDIACDLGDPNPGDESTSTENCHMQATSDLLVGENLAAVLPLGDNQYEDGTLAKFQKYYALTWGRLMAISHPVAGNHEYESDGAAGYYSYFGASAGDKTKGYYSFDIGRWHLIALNANCSAIGGCQAGSPQEIWLRADLAAHPAVCTLAYWHQPRFSSALHGNNADTSAFWEDLYQSGAEIVLNGHDHDYERFAPQTPKAIADSKHGIREFVVGTGGRSLYPFMTSQPNSEVQNDQTYGVLKLTLHPQGYSWKFVPEKAKTFTDSGNGTCH